jgi:NADH-ubiquinone oxidoreductase chain 5
VKLYSLVTFYLGFILLTFSLSSIWAGLNFWSSQEVYFIEWDLVTINSSSLILTFLLDWIRLLFVGFVTLVSSIVMFYRTFYIEGDKYFYRFIVLIYLFVLSMVLLILSPNIIRILLGWDGLGLVSYCLVIFYQNVKSANAGILTVLSNRVGDVAILLCISWLLNFGSWNFYYLQFMYNYSELSFVLFLVVLAGITKRAQIPFSAWLPAAIAAPTPVSALVHSSTLVTAGVYLLIRFHTLLGVNNFLFYIGVFTIFMSGLGANFETDLKKIIALSTLRQLGLIIMTLSMGFYELSFFHLLTHALFKSLLFLCAGVFIHSTGDVQDIRHLGGVIVSCPVTSLFFIGASIALCGFPFLAGFYSRDLILEVYFMGFINFPMWGFIFFSTMFTLTYSVRLIYFLFFKNLGVKTLFNLEESLGILVPIRLLFFISVLAGSLIRWSCFPSVLIFLPFLVKVSITILSVFFSIVFYLANRLKALSVVRHYSRFVYFFGSMWLLPFLSSVLFIPVTKLGEILVKVLDQGWLEQYGGQGILNVLREGGSVVDYFYGVDIKLYLLSFFFILVFLFTVIYLNSSIRVRR